MKKINIKDLIDFRRGSKKRKSHLARKLKQRQSAEEESSISSGGDYWVRSISALNNAFKEGDNTIISNKIEAILNDYSPQLIEKTKLMYDRNLQILYNFEDFDFGNLKPNAAIEVLKKERKQPIFYIKDLPVKIMFHQIYSFESHGQKSLGTVLFLAKLEGYKPSELGLFAESLYKYLTVNYGSDYVISPADIRIIEVTRNTVVNYQMILEGELPSLLDDTLDEIIRFQNAS